MTNSNRVCLSSEPGDSSYFGFSVAINDKYLAVGDPNANRVCIYTRNDSDLWTRSNPSFMTLGKKYRISKQ